MQKSQSFITKDSRCTLSLHKLRVRLYALPLAQLWRLIVVLYLNKTWRGKVVAGEPSHPYTPHSSTKQSIPSIPHHHINPSRDIASQCLEATEIIVMYVAHHKYSAVCILCNACMSHSFHHGRRTHRPGQEGPTAGPTWTAARLARGTCKHVQDLVLLLLPRL